MTTTEYIDVLEKLIEQHQAIQQANAPATDKWQRASREINRLAALIVDARKRQTENVIEERMLREFAQRVGGEEDRREKEGGF
jgi:hypothetical protein